MILISDRVILPTEPKKIKIVCSLHNLFLKNLLLNRRKIALQYCVGFCHTTMQISHNYTHITSLLSLPPCSPSHPSSSLQSPSSAPCVYTTFSPAIYFTHGSVFTLMLLPLFVPLFPFPTVSTSPFSICVC